MIIRLNNPKPHDEIITNKGKAFLKEHLYTHIRNDGAIKECWRVILINNLEEFNVFIETGHK